MSALGDGLLIHCVRFEQLGFRWKPYVPDFKLAFDHFCMHTGGRAVIDAIEEQLELTPELAQPSKEALRRYGNVSSSSIW